MDNILPTNCPSCGTGLKWSNSGADLYCLNSECDAKTGRQLVHFFGMLNNIDGFGPFTIDNLINNGFDTIPKIYKMRYQDFQDCGYLHKTIMNLGIELEGSKDRPLPDYRFLAALGIPNLGISGAKKLLEHYNLHSIMFDMTPDDLMQVDGFGLSKAESIFDYSEKNYDLITDIYQIGFNIIHEEVEVKESPITGKRITFSGKMQNNRKDMELEAESLGAIITGVNSKSDILVCGARIGQNKVTAAKKFGVAMITEDEYLNLIK